MKIVFQIFVLLALLAFTAETSKLCLKKENTSCKVDDTDDNEEEPTEEDTYDDDDFKSIWNLSVALPSTTSSSLKNNNWMVLKAIDFQENNFQSLTLNPPENC